MVHDPANQPHGDAHAGGAKCSAPSFPRSPASPGWLELAFADLRDRLDGSMPRSEPEMRAVHLKSCPVEPIVVKSDGTYGLPTLTLALDRSSLAVTGWHLG